MAEPKLASLTQQELIAEVERLEKRLKWEQQVNAKRKSPWSVRKAHPLWHKRLKQADDINQKNSELWKENVGLKKQIQELTAESEELAGQADRFALDLENLEKLLKEFIEALVDLELREARYRFAHDVHGSQHATTGYEWDQMRNAGDRARALIARRGKQQ